MVPRTEREKAEAAMNTELWTEIKKTEGAILGTAHQFLEHINKMIWHFVNNFERLLNIFSQRIPKLKKISKRLSMYLAGFFLMWGYIRISGYIINILSASKLSSPIMIVRKRMMKHFVLNLLFAIIATALFYILNVLFKPLQPQ
jgi:hypothetical protein